MHHRGQISLLKPNNADGNNSSFPGAFISDSLFKRSFHIPAQRGGPGTPTLPCRHVGRKPPVKCSILWHTESKCSVYPPGCSILCIFSVCVCSSEVAAGATEMQLEDSKVKCTAKAVCSPRAELYVSDELRADFLGQRQFILNVIWFTFISSFLDRNLLSCLQFSNKPLSLSNLKTLSPTKHMKI